MKNPMLADIAKVLLIIGGLNWGLVGAFNFNLVEQLLGFSPLLVDLVYLVVGIAAVFALVSCISKKAS